MRKVLLSALMVGVVTTGAMAGTVSDDFQVTVSVPDSCVLNTGASDVTINYDPLHDNWGDVTQTTSTTIDCVVGTTYDVQLSGDGVNYEYDSTNITLTNQDDSNYTMTLDVSASSTDQNTTGANGETIYTSGGSSTITYSFSNPQATSYHVGDYTGNVYVLITY